MTKFMVDGEDFLTRDAASFKMNKRVTPCHSPKLVSTTTCLKSIMMQGSLRQRCNNVAGTAKEPDRGEKVHENFDGRSVRDEVVWGKTSGGEGP